MTFTPAANYNGPADFSYTVTDGSQTSAPATVSITVAAVADALVLAPVSNIYVLNSGNTLISTGSSDVAVTAYEMGAGVTQVNLEAELGVAAGYLDNRFNPTGPNINDPGFVNVVDGKLSESHYSMKAGTSISWDYSFRNGEDLNSEVSAGYNDIVVLLVTDPLGNKQSILVDSSEEKFPALTSNGTQVFTASMEGNYSFQWMVLNSGDAYKDSSLALSNIHVNLAGNSTNYGTPIDMPVFASLADTDGSEVLSVKISGIPSGAAFDAGINNGDGSWSFTGSELQGLHLLTPAGYTGTLNLSVTATATELSNGATATSTQNMSIEVSTTTNTVSTGTEAGNTLTGTAANDLIRGYAGNDVVNAGDGNDMVYGGAGNDTLSGQGGNDWLYGGVGSDILVGGIGNDQLIGGAGNDTLTGGTGADVFRWELGDRGTSGAPATDTISSGDFDLVAKSDQLDLRDLLQGESHAGIDPGNLGNYLHFTVSGGSTTVEVKSTGAGSADQVIQIAGVDLSSGVVPHSGQSLDQAIIQDLLTKGKLLTD